MKSTTYIPEITTQKNERHLLGGRNACLLVLLLASYQLRNFPREFTEKCFAVFDQSSHAIYLTCAVAETCHMISFLILLFWLFSFVIFVLMFSLFHFVHFVFVLILFWFCFHFVHFNYLIFLIVFSSIIILNFISFFEMKPNENQLAESWQSA